LTVVAKMLILGIRFHLVLRTNPLQTGDIFRTTIGVQNHNQVKPLLIYFQLHGGLSKTAPSQDSGQVFG
jgi:hypothetical protein